MSAICTSCGNSQDVVEKITHVLQKMTSSAQSMSSDYKRVHEWYDNRGNMIQMHDYFPNSHSNGTALSNCNTLVAFFEIDM